MENLSFLDMTLLIAFGLLFMALLISFYRLIKGPSIPDRVVALDMITHVAMGMIALFIFTDDLIVFLDAIGVVALVAFIGTIAYANHLIKRGDVHV